MRVLSLFDGISCGQIALNKAGIDVEKYYASEIKEIAMKVTQFNYPDTEQVGDVTELDFSKYKDVDILIGGSPCQDLSIAMSNRQGLKGSQSSLFYYYTKALEIIKPKYFLLENVARMSAVDKDTITNALGGVQPMRINSSLVSAQLRDRLYWTNIPGVSAPIDKDIKLQDVLESGYTKREKSRALLVSDSRPLKDKKRMWHRFSNTGFTTVVCESKEFTVDNLRYFTQLELERLQTVPIGYTQVVKRDDAADLLGDAWTVDVIAHIFSFIPKAEHATNS